MNVLIVGGTGYIGSHVALDLARAGHAVTVVARERGSTQPERADALTAAGIRRVYADLSQPNALASIDATPWQVVVHGVCSFLEPAKGESLTLRAGTEVTAFCQRCPDLRQVIDLSSALVLAPPPADALPDEDAPCAPETAHGRNKLEAERMLARAGLPWVSLRIGQVYGGPGSSFDWVVVEPIRRGGFPVPGNGRNKVALVHVDDVAQAVRLTIAAGVRDRVFNIAAGEPALTLGQVFDAVAAGFRLPPPMRLPLGVALGYAWFAEHGARLLGREPKLVVDMIHVLSANRSMDITRARRELGFTPAFPDSIAGIASAYAEVFAGAREPFNPAGRLAYVRGNP